MPLSAAFAVERLLGAHREDDGIAARARASWFFAYASASLRSVAPEMSHFVMTKTILSRDA